MGILDFLEREEVTKIATDYLRTEVDKDRIGFNLLTISSYTSHLENFHSDIIAALLDPNGLHGDGRIFFDLLIDYLNEQHTAGLDKYDFRNPVITREKGRIDIWVRDKMSKKAIIIENKINNAPDTDNQLETYLNRSEEKYGYKVCCIVYLSADGCRRAPISKLKKVNALTKNIAAYNNTNGDLYNGWLTKCMVQNIHAESHSFIHQYSKLIPHLSNSKMNTEVKEQFYAFLSQNKALKTVQAIFELTSKLPEYRADKFFNSIESYEPFRKSYRWRPNHWLFEKYQLGENVYKIDVVFSDDGSASLHFWNPGKPEEIQEHTTKDMLIKINMLDSFITGGYGGGMKKEFEISDYGYDIAALDNDLLNIFREIVRKFREVSN